MSAEHYRALEKMYLAASINKIYPPTVEVSQGQTCITLEVRPEYFNSTNSLHGSVYFKLLDDCAGLAACSIHDEVVPVTVNFNIDIKKPVTGGQLKAVGRTVKVDGKKIFTESVLYDEAGDEVASGRGVFYPSATTFADIPAYLS